MMEEDKMAEEACEKLDFSANKGAETGASTLPRGEEQQAKSCSPGRISKLERDLLAVVTDIQAAADAKESKRREELEEARRIRSELLEKDVKSSQEKFEEITARWALAEQVVVPQELQETLKWQQLLCAELIEDKRKVIKDLQQELKRADHRYVKDLRRQAEELDLMMRRSEEVIATLTQAYREELDHIESIYQQEHDVLLTKDQTEWEQSLKEMWDQQQERLAERKKTVEEYEAKIHDLMMDPEYKYDAERADHFADIRVLEREHQQMLADSMISNVNYIKDKHDREIYNLSHMKSRILSLQTELKNLKSTCASSKKQSEKQSSCLSNDYKRSIEQYQCVQRRIRHFAVADARQFEETWRMLDKEVRQQAEKALLIDSIIYKQHLGLAWARPPGASAVDLSGPCNLRKRAGPEHGGAGMDEAAAASEEEEEVPLETMKELMELLCDELDFLTEDRLQLLETLGKKERNVVKLEALLHVFGMEEEDIPKLADFLLKYQQRQPAEGRSAGPVESGDKSQESATSSACNPNYILPALKDFLKHHSRFRSQASGQPRYWSADMWDSSSDEAYWESLASVITGDKLKVWDAAESILKKHMPDTWSLQVCQIFYRLDMAEKHHLGGIGNRCSINVEEQHPSWMSFPLTLSLRLSLYFLLLSVSMEFLLQFNTIPLDQGADASGFCPWVLRGLSRSYSGVNHFCSVLYTGNATNKM
ncbi:dynein regulatory complex protein 1 isoform X2 [Phyllopteryx taeniolatus]|uniref:dynein regulatory complex protein 1 isoform X2 n=1 Tax=Phyllopteryx taeniolatus TaxID=161469 RepID=UPI002AD43589|nr:dynein regulatory complex protein 1 isoform X2 [Phyllopteryx taeniolatus]